METTPLDLPYMLFFFSQSLKIDNIAWTFANHDPNRVENISFIQNYRQWVFN